MRVRLASSPSGAMVAVLGKVYGPTPADVELWGEQVARGAEVRFVFEKEGYESVSVSRHVASELIQLDVELPRKGGNARTHGHAESESLAAVEPVTGPGRVKETPYERPSDLPAFPPALAAVPTTRVEEPAPAALPTLAPSKPAEPAPAPVAVAAPAPAPAQAVPAPQAAAASTFAPRKVRGAMREGDTVFPEYPRAARRAGVSGVVIARVAVRADGSVSAVDVLEGPAVFHDAVRAALRTWHYRPAKLADGTSVPDTHVVRIPFKLN